MATATVSRVTTMSEHELEFLMSKEPLLSPRFVKLLVASRTTPRNSGPSERYLFSHARNALYHGLRVLGLGTGDVVLLPSFLCAAAIEPVIAIGARPEFYRIDRDCRPDLTDLATRIRPQTRAIFAVHYFGFPCPIEMFRQLCDSHGLFLIEDCAHVLDLGGDHIGRVGDIAVISWRKFLPLYDGGELILNRPLSPAVNWEKVGLLACAKAVKTLVKQAAERSKFLPSRAVRALLQLRMPSLIRLGRSLPDLTQGVLADTQFEISKAMLPMSPVSRWIMHHCDFPAILAKRQANFAYYQRAFRSLP